MLVQNVIIIHRRLLPLSLLIILIVTLVALVTVVLQLAMVLMVPVPVKPVALTTLCAILIVMALVVNDKQNYDFYLLNSLKVKTVENIDLMKKGLRPR